MEHRSKGGVLLSASSSAPRGAKPGATRTGSLAAAAAGALAAAFLHWALTAEDLRRMEDPAHA